jgi:hypothetical protein
MKLTTVIGTAIAALSLAACSSTVVPTARPATPTPIATAAPTATPTAVPTPTPTPSTPGVYVTVTCSNVPVMWANPFPPGSILGIATWHNLTMGDYFGIGLDVTNLVTSPTMSVGVEGIGIANNAFQQGTWGWTEVSGPDGEVTVAQGSLTIPACAPNVRVTACDHAGTASGGAIAWSEPGYSTLTITGPAPSTYHFTLPASAGRYGPLTAGSYSDRLDGSGASVSGAFTIPACPG